MKTTHHNELDVFEVIQGSADSACGAVMSEDARCRFLLWRNWGRGPRRCVFIGLNPSTADASRDDATARRCIAFARAWDCTGMLMVNLFATRSTHPDGIVVDQETVTNGMYQRVASASADIIVAAWGAHTLARIGYSRADFPLTTNQRLHCLGTNKDGSPKHPLYLAKSSTLGPYLGYP